MIRQLQNPSTLALLLRTVIGLVLLAAAGGLVWVLMETSPTIETEDRPRSLRVPVLVVEPINLPRQWRGFGTVQAERQADVPARVGATVREIPEAVEVGRVIKAKELIAQLDDTDFVKDRDSAQQRIEEINASLNQLKVEEDRLRDRLVIEQEDRELAQREYDRQVERRESGAATDIDVDRTRRTLLQAERAVLQIQQQIDAIAPRRAGLEANRAGAEAQRDVAEQNVQRARILSPMDGIIAELDIEENENVAPGSRIARIVDPRLIEVPIQLPASARGQIGIGDTVTVTSRSHPPDCLWAAEITRLGAFNDPTRTFTVYTRVEQDGVPLSAFATGGRQQQVLVPGMFVTASLETREEQLRWVLPARSVQDGRIRLVVGDRVQTRGVEIAFNYEGQLPSLGVEDQQWVVLEQPLERGDRVVLSASLSILDGQEVIAVQPRQIQAERQPDGDAATSPQTDEGRGDS